MQDSASTESINYGVGAKNVLYRNNGDGTFTYTPGAGEQGTVTFKVDNAPFTADIENIDKARIMPDWVALGLAPSKPTGPAKRPKPTKNPSNEPAAKKPRAE